MIGGLITFLVGCIVLIIVLAVIRIVLKKIPMDPDIVQIVWLIVGLLALVFLIGIVYAAFNSAVIFGGVWNGGPVIIR